MDAFTELCPSTFQTSYKYTNSLEKFLLFMNKIHGLLSSIWSISNKFYRKALSLSPQVWCYSIQMIQVEIISFKEPDLYTHMPYLISLFSYSLPISVYYVISCLTIYSLEKQWKGKLISSSVLFLKTSPDEVFVMAAGPRCYSYVILFY